MSSPLRGSHVPSLRDASVTEATSAKLRCPSERMRGLRVRLEKKTKVMCCYALALEPPPAESMVTAPAPVSVQHQWDGWSGPGIPPPLQSAFSAEG